MLRRILSRILPSIFKAPADSPADVSFWTRLGHTPSRAEKIARCFPEYWKRKGQPDAERYAKHYFDQETGIIPLSYEYPSNPQYASLNVSTITIHSHGAVSTGMTSILSMKPSRSP